MPEVYRSIVVDAEAEDVWETIRDFAGMENWYPGIEPGAVRVENDKSGDAVGAIRAIEMPGDVTVREKLLEHSDYRRFYSYRILDYPLPLQDYVGTLQVRRITESPASFVEWSSRFDVESEMREEGVQNIKSVYQEGLEALREQFG